MTKAQLLVLVAQLKQENEELRAAQVAKPKPINTARSTEQIVGTYTNRAGVTMHKIRIGFNQFVHRAA